MRAARSQGGPLNGLDAGAATPYGRLIERPTSAGTGMRFERSTGRSVIYVAMTFVLLFGPQASADSGVLPEGPIDTAFLFRLLLSGLLGILIWLARGTDSRLKEVEKHAHEITTLAQTRGDRLNLVEKNIELINHEQKQQMTLISMQRELLLTKYHDKEETERHRVKIEDALTAHGNTLTAICTRLDHFVRPTHRSEDDERRYRGLDKPNPPSGR